MLSKHPPQTMVIFGIINQAGFFSSTNIQDGDDSVLIDAHWKD